MGKLAFALLALAFSLSAYTTGVIADQRSVREDVYKKLLQKHDRRTGRYARGGAQVYKGRLYSEIRVGKVLAICINWKKSAPGNIYSRSSSAMYDTQGGQPRFESAKRTAVYECQHYAKSRGHDCKCQIVDVNGKNKLKIPASFLKSMEGFQEGNLRHADLQGVSFVNSNLQGFNLKGANLQKANLSGARLQKANLDGASLVNAYLQFANLQGASFRNANFRKAMLNAADLLGAKFQGADLSGARGLTQEQLDKACGDENTKLPKNLTIKRCPKDGE